MKKRKMVNVNAITFKDFLVLGGILDTDDFPIWENCRWKLGNVYNWETGESYLALITEPDLSLSFNTPCFIPLKGMEKAVDLLEKTGIVTMAYDITCDDFIAIDEMDDRFVMLAIDSCQSYNIPEDSAREVGIIE